MPPKIDVGSQAVDSTDSAFFQEELSVYKDSSTAAKTFDLGIAGLTCTQGTTSNGQAAARRSGVNAKQGVDRGDGGVSEGAT